MSKSSPKKNKKWQEIIRPYMVPDNKKSWFQVANTLVPFLFLWYLSYRAYLVSFWLGLPLSLINAGFLLRLFIIMHDCGHGNFLTSAFWRDLIGHFIGWLTLTPYRQWCTDHALHHSTSGNLDKRGYGDVWTVTAQEYAQMKFYQKVQYRIYRSPIVIFVFGPLYLSISQRLFQSHDGKLERRSVIYTNIFLATVIPLLCWIIGPKAFLAIFLPNMLFAQVLGIYFFYVQHQYPQAYWKKGKEWDYFEASMQGSSFLKLPKILQWFSGSIGYHHVHHLCHLIPNYKLQQCHEENPLFQNPVQLGFWKSLKGLTLHLYDEKKRELISFSEYRRRYPNGIAALKEVRP